MRLRDAEEKHLGRTNLKAGVWAKQMKSVYLTKNQKRKQQQKNNWTL